MNRDVYYVFALFGAAGSTEAGPFGERVSGPYLNADTAYAALRASVSTGMLRIASSEDTGTTQ